MNFYVVEGQPTTGTDCTGPNGSTDPAYNAVCSWYLIQGNKYSQ